MATILVIEDIEANFILVNKLLRAHGHDVLWAENGETGLEMVTEHRPDLILLDLGLPDIDGQTLVRYIRKEPELKSIPIIVVTAWPEETAKMMVEAYGCDGYIGKPINIHRFIDIVNENLPQDV
jgi:two-component system, cell cycle response regulator DivK